MFVPPPPAFALILQFLVVPLARGCRQIFRLPGVRVTPVGLLTGLSPDPVAARRELSLCGAFPSSIGSGVPSCCSQSSGGVHINLHGVDTFADARLDDPAFSTLVLDWFVLLAFATTCKYPPAAAFPAESVEVGLADSSELVPARGQPTLCSFLLSDFNWSVESPGHGSLA